MVPPSLAEPFAYAADMGGKLVRPALFHATAISISGCCKHSPTPLALELIHTYSLIHDDLPAMDDDDLRRGKPTLHRAFDEATAILVGDGLQARAFELIADADDLSAEQKVRMIKVLAEASGFAGMVGGQYVDIQSTGKALTLEELKAMHAMKTGALIRASVALGGIAGGATEEQLAALDRYADNIGLAFQVVDDILDVEGDTETLGKTQGKDEAANKATYVKLMGLEGAKAEAARLLDEALAALEGFGESADMLRELARYIVERDR
ncbi:polyprenyl synthetase family protein [Parahaliea maris]|uniref:Polyprenyl synthetase family protein n=1 Tax=Parahaliea maris TaxID=2716870 RepID=A0A5C9A7P3_9GAMM|nr:farnesyl diphosphate synthase [Parahaliea maris]TXS96696.1 polyprenyl synthetase family protein [Parahaliea maris]